MLSFLTGVQTSAGFRPFLVWCLGSRRRAPSQSQLQPQTWPPPLLFSLWRPPLHLFSGERFLGVSVRLGCSEISGTQEPPAARDNPMTKPELGWLGQGFFLSLSLRLLTLLVTGFRVQMGILFVVINVMVMASGAAVVALLLTENFVGRRFAKQVQVECGANDGC
ncbi:hypothetical protein QBC34DRAFT_102228 [Podospora aff. communis PSN243]|uniref:Copper transporter n=1 Tax=Podospora aff. communis PSN243 TaxID=3040156 RepID=A0AAV9GJM8_9PEZI|nr:hypothetical protein QBC34DRAFT_102228 [Podospora aff. communis PSN243]